MANRLANSISPYLLQHAQNPVDWFTWDEEALLLSKEQDKPIFLSIGYAACHWCHVMAHESFEDQVTAEFMNRHFVNIKVDREERPDLDSIYMTATVALTGSGGWPMSVFLTPELQPFYAGTYFPPVRRHNMPAFREVLGAVAEAWKNERGKILESSQRITAQLRSLATVSRYELSITKQHLSAAVHSLRTGYDWGYGGWGSAPKFPQPMSIEFLLRRHQAGEPQALEPALHALHAMGRGGMYDVIGGGFARYSTDNFWRVPHFEKMLYDNALLARAYLHAWQITSDPHLLEIANDTLAFIEREMTHPEGGFHSSIDADSEGQEGKYYVWTEAQIEAVLGPEFEFFKAAYGLSPQGNWEGKTVLQRALDDDTLAARFSADRQSVRQRLAVDHARLLQDRNSRVRPATDDKVLTAWNGMMLATLAEAARACPDAELRAKYHAMASRNARFLLGNLRTGGELRRAWRAGRRSGEAFLEDYAALILGLTELYQTDFQVEWFAAAQELAQEMISRFEDPEWGFFDAPSGTKGLVLRPKDLQDNATPSGNALACEALLRLAALAGHGDFEDRAQRSIRHIAEAALRHPTAFAYWLIACDFSVEETKQVALVGDPADPGMQSLLQVAREGFRPHQVVALSAHPQPAQAPGLLAGREPVAGQPTAYVCKGFVCELPETEVEGLRNRLAM